MISGNLKRSRASQSKPRLVFGPVPLLNYKYISGSLREKGYECTTLVTSHFNNINNKQDFDLYCDEIPFSGFQKKLSSFLKKHYPENYSLLIFDYVIKHFDIVHISCLGGYLYDTKYWRKEAALCKRMGIKTIILTYGGDFYRYSQIEDVIVRHGLLLSYPASALQESVIEEKVKYWTVNADCFLSGHCIDGIGRWDAIPFSYLCIDTKNLPVKKNYSEADGTNGIVYITHSPNHKGIKGTEFLLEAVRELQEEGLKIELILLENVKNDTVLDVFANKADIHAEQFVFSAYGLNGIEGMQAGLPVMTNLENPVYTRLFRLYSYLGECPVFSTKIEDIKDNLRILIKNPALRKELGMKGRAYVEKYHSYNSNAYLFENIYDKIWTQKDINLMNLFNPRRADSLNNRSALISVPKIANNGDANSK